MLGNRATTSKDIKISSSCRTISLTFWIESIELLASKPSIPTIYLYSFSSHDERFRNR
jgi:hypothetical protein